MIARLSEKKKYTAPAFDVAELRNESDVEQKLVYPFLTNTSYLAIPPAWVRSKEYMTPTEIDKAAGKRYGYFPDYSVWLSGLPLVVGEVNEPGVKVEEALREARLTRHEFRPPLSAAAFPFRCAGSTLAAISLDPIHGDQCTRRPLIRSKRPPRCPSHSLARPCVQACRSRRPSVAPTSELGANINPHSARCPAATQLPATSCLGAFWTPAA